MFPVVAEGQEHCWRRATSERGRQPDRVAQVGVTGMGRCRDKWTVGGVNSASLRKVLLRCRTLTEKPRGDSATYCAKSVSQALGGKKLVGGSLSSPHKGSFKLKSLIELQELRT